MDTKQKPFSLVIAAGMKARHLTGELHNALNTEERWLEKQLEGASIKLTLNPHLKKVLYEVCADRRIAMVDYCRAAVLVAIKRDLAADIAEMEALDQPLAMSIDGPEDADVLDVRIGAAK